MARNPGRPLSPHLTIWKWGPHMLVSILHRATGVAMATVAVMTFLWWLIAAASGPDAYGTFAYYIFQAENGDVFGQFVNLLARLAAVVLTWAFFQHMASGIRHLVLDIGAGYELRTNKTGALATMVVSTVITLALWAWVFSRS